MAEWYAQLGTANHLVVRANFSQASLVLLAELHAQAAHLPFKHYTVVYIETGWESEDWPTYVAQGADIARQFGFNVVTLNAPAFSDLIKDRAAPPTPKFQWCAGMLKGVPLLNWLDAHDLAGEWVVAIPKRQSVTRVPVPSLIAQCPYHGDRAVVHPIAALDEGHYQAYCQRYRWQDWPILSRECAPCVNDHTPQLQTLAVVDCQKTTALEQKLGQSFFPPTRFGGFKGIKQQQQWAQQQPVSKQATKGEHFSRGCGDSFGCGL